MISFMEKIAPETILAAILIFIWLIYIWEQYLECRQKAVYRSVLEVPNSLVGIVEQETFNKSRLYSIDKFNFAFIKDIFSQILTTVFIYFWLLKYFWRFSAYILISVGIVNNEILQSCVCTLLLSILGTLISLPFSIYHTFVLEEKYGFNKQTAVFFVKDLIKGILVSQVIGLPILSAIIYIVQIGGTYFFVYLWIFSVVISLFLMTIYPTLIAPIFDKYYLLPDGELKTNIEKLAQSIGFPLTKIYVVEGSKRSAHSNAYFYGFFKNKRIVLFDTLLEGILPCNKNVAENSTTEPLIKDNGEHNTEENKDQSDNIENEATIDNIDESVAKKENDFTALENNESVVQDVKSDKEEFSASSHKESWMIDEILGVLCHELGHWYCNHMIKNIILSQLNLLIIFGVFALLYKYKNLYMAFGFTDEQPVLVGLFIIFQYVCMPYGELISFLMTILSRRFEFQADKFAKDMGRGSDLCSALIKLHRTNLSFPVYDWLFSAWHLSHPPLLERLDALQFNKKEE